MLVYNLHFAVICTHPDTEFCLNEIKHIAIKNYNKKNLWIPTQQQTVLPISQS